MIEKYEIKQKILNNSKTFFWQKNAEKKLSLSKKKKCDSLKDKFIGTIT